MTWPVGAPGVVELPSGRRVRGRGLRQDLPAPDHGLVLLGRDRPVPWPHRWVAWPDFRLPRSPDDLRAALGELLDRAGSERVELACAGGTGRTGTALACLAVLDGVPPGHAVAWVRAHYRPRAVETPAQRRFVTRWTR
ncbi:protein-tyrosine phosphatase family protein [Klenkia taihuensis]|uniref:Protein-tyrosine phosphatase n=1 Tax=Klenkia taihuensis TaxID=1225127 RepID=A0A1I1S6Z8_9ACTN|nr:protein-tyrosine phosphatase family protein [Klenkia taihuensis]GHE13636.1 protein-tyrosine-phosphatase [Klenkia taihuensis]SFD42289.1 Protein-tyrosine phosphatase [Klenkia taihuensis]